MPIYFEDDQVSLFAPDFYVGKTSPAHSPAGSRKARISESFSKRSSELSSMTYMFLDLSEDAGNLLGESYWEIHSPWRGDAFTGLVFGELDMIPSDGEQDIDLDFKGLHIHITRVEDHQIAYATVTKLEQPNDDAADEDNYIKTEPPMQD